MVLYLYNHQGFFGQLKLLNKQNLTYINKYLHIIMINLITIFAQLYPLRHIWQYREGRNWWNLVTLITKFLHEKKKLFASNPDLPELSSKVLFIKPPHSHLWYSSEILTSELIQNCIIEVHTVNAYASHKQCVRTT